MSNVCGTNARGPSSTSALACNATGVVYTTARRHRLTQSRVPMRSAREPTTPGVQMVLIGFVLVAAAAVVGIDVAAQNNFAVDMDAFGQVMSTTAAGVFVAGLVTGLAAA